MTTTQQKDSFMQVTESYINEAGEGIYTYKQQNMQ